MTQQVTPYCHIVPDFGEVYQDDQSVGFLSEVFTAVSICDLWDWLKKTPFPNFSYSAEHEQQMKELQRYLTKVDSGMSFGWSMSIIHRIAHCGGWEKFKEYLSNKSHRK